jgi:transposase-like protein
MAQFSPEVRASARHQYEETDKPIRQIAHDHATSQRTINRWRDEDGWTRRSDQLRGLPAATRLLDEATALLAARGTDCHSRESGNPVIADITNTAAPRVLGPRLRGDDMLSELRDQSDAAAATRTSQQAAIERIERLVEKELEIEEAARAALGTLPRPPADAERAARTLATLTQVLHALARLRGGLSPDVESNDDDDMPRDTDEFRRDLARRIDAWVASRTEPRHAEGYSGPSKVDAVR